MASHISTYELTGTRTAAGGSVRNDATYLQTDIVQNTGDQGGFTDPVIAPAPVPMSGYGTDKHPARWVRIQIVTDDPTDLLILEASKPADGFWIANGVPTDNGEPIGNAYQNSQQFPSGRVTPAIIYIFAGDVATLVSALTGTVTGYRISYFLKYFDTQLYQGQAHLCEFEEVPTANALISTRAGQLLKQLNGDGNRAALGQLVNGTVISVPNCVLAGLAPEGAVYIAPEDIGSNNDQIPTSVLNNTAAKFRFHPSVFVRRGAYWNSVTRRQFDGIQVAEEDQGMPCRVVVVDAPITQSAWMIGIDGVMGVYYVQHPGPLDLRRPRDIWEQVWLPILQGGTGATVKTGLGANITAIGDLSRFQYLEYARCLPLPGTETPQTDIAEA